MGEIRLASRKKLGLIVNPVAGMGGRVGLKGTDGEETVRKAIELGASRISHSRTMEALGPLYSLRDQFGLFTYPFEMGEEPAKESGFTPTILGRIERGKTSASDTRTACQDMLKAHVDLLLFVGGDGTARDVYESVGQTLPVLGVPSGVKVHSGVFGITPKRAGRLATSFLHGHAKLQEAEVMDVDEAAFRQGHLSAKLHGYLLVPYDDELVQSTKGGSSASPEERTSLQILADYVAELMEDENFYILGPGTTVKAIADRLATTKTLLGVDVVKGRRTVALDVNEAQLLKMIEGRRAKIVVSPIGRQGFIFGRGNQQISPTVIKKVGVENVLIISTPNKLASVQTGKPFLVDTGDNKVDMMLSGYRRIITGYREEVVVKVAS
jgi:predicted polyphosphate/ATP-dependent NAD kinase